MIRKVAILVLLIAVFLTGCSSTAATPSTPATVVGKPVTVEGGTYTDVSVPELQTMLASKDFIFVNVHIPFEGDIANTDHSIPFDQITQNLDLLPGKDDKIVLYCRSDRMSMIAAEELVKLGYTNVWNLDGGMVAWENAGLEIQR